MERASESDGECRLDHVSLEHVRVMPRVVGRLMAVMCRGRGRDAMVSD